MHLVITDGFELNPGDLSWAEIYEIGDVAYYESTAKDQLIERCKNARVIIVNKTRIDASLFASAPGLKLITVTATGYNNIDVQAAKTAGVAVCNVPEYGTFSVAQHTLALILELMNQVGVHAASVKNKDWERSDRWSYSKQPLKELWGKTLGIVGFGRIGQRVAEMGKAFGMEIVFHNRSPKISSLGRQVSLEELFILSDIVSLHCPLTNDNAGFINRDRLSLMKPSAVLINTSRGQLINEQHLADALQSGILAAAGLDVLSNEPPVQGNPLIGLSNCIITPHNAWSTSEARARLMKVTNDNIRQFLAGKPQNLVV